MQIKWAIRLLVSFSMIGMAVSLYFMNKSLNSARTQRDTAIERSNSQGETVRLLRVELSSANQKYEDAVLFSNSIVQALSDSAKQTRDTNALLSKEFRNSADKWSRFSGSLQPLPVSTVCEERIDNMDKFLSNVIKGAK